MIHGTTRKTHLWTPDSDERLLKAVATFGHDNWSVGACLATLRFCVCVHQIVQLHVKSQKMLPLANVRTAINVLLTLP